MTITKGLVLTGITLAIITILTMGLFSFFKKSPAPKQITQKLADNPYKDDTVDFIYNLLFCDNFDLYKSRIQPPYSYPFDVLFSENSTANDLQKIIDDKSGDPRIKILAYNKQREIGHKSNQKELLAVIVEVGLDDGLDVLAAFENGTARYINQTGKILVWEKIDDAKANDLTHDLFAKSQQIVNQIGPWEKPRKPHPTKGNTRITFIVSGELYLGEAPTDVLFSDSLASPALTSATQLMQYLTAKSLEQNPNN